MDAQGTGGAETVTPNSDPLGRSVSSKEASNAAKSNGVGKK
jgi:hypothetical protein